MTNPPPLSPAPSVLGLGKMLGIVVITVIVVSALAFIGRWVSGSGSQHNNQERRCYANCSSIAKALGYYTSDPVNEGDWPWVKGTTWDSPTGTNRLKEPPNPSEAADERAITSLPFLLIRQSLASVKVFKCPLDQKVTTQEDVVVTGDRQEYDFRGPEHVSYSYVAPITVDGKVRNGARAGADSKGSTVVLSDRNPFLDGRTVGPWTDNMSEDDCRRLLSGNHGGATINCIWMDFHVSTEVRADIGTMKDNIYSAGGNDEKTWRQSVSTKLTDHTNMEDSFLIGPYGK